MTISRRKFLNRNLVAASLATVSPAFIDRAVADSAAAKAGLKEKLAAKSWTQFRGDAFATGVAESKLSDDLKLLWKYEVDGGAFESTPVVLDGTCYVPDLDGYWHAIGLADGNLKWKKKTKAFAFAASPAFRDGKLFVGDIDGYFYCYSLDGEEEWKFETGAEINSSATFYGDNVLFGSQDATLYCLDR